MASENPVQPARWQKADTPPCTVAYHFTLLDINQELRYCCRGDKIHAAYTGLREQWAGKEYSEFRKHWAENYEQKQDLCVGCPHFEENRRWNGVVQNYLKQHEPIANTGGD